MSEEKRKLSPMFLIAPGAMKPKDIRRAERLCGIVIIECKDTDSARHLEAPIGAEIDLQAWAALSLVRQIIKQETSYPHTISKSDIINRFVNMLLDGKPIPPTRSVQSVKK